MVAIKIKETGQIETLSIIDPKTGMDWSADLIGNNTGPGNDVWDGDHETHAWVMTQDAFDWWSRYIDAQQVVDDRAHEMQLTWEEQEYFRDTMPGCDMEDQPAAETEILDQIEEQRKSAT